MAQMLSFQRSHGCSLKAVEQERRSRILRLMQLLIQMLKLQLMLVPLPMLLLRMLRLRRQQMNLHLPPDAEPSKIQQSLIRSKEMLLSL